MKANAVEVITTISYYFPWNWSAESDSSVCMNMSNTTDAQFGMMYVLCCCCVSICLFVCLAVCHIILFSKCTVSLFLTNEPECPVGILNFSFGVLNTHQGVFCHYNTKYASFNLHFLNNISFGNDLHEFFLHFTDWNSDKLLSFIYVHPHPLT